MSITFSIVTISYNQAAYLEQCLDSILSQNVSVEYIVMDGGSTDGSVDLIRRREDRMHYWVSQKDGGAPNALNAGFARANGEFIGYINSDDYLLPNALETLQKVIEENPGYDVYYGPGYIQNEITGQTKLVTPTLWHLGVYRAGYSVMIQQSIFFRREKLVQTGTEFNPDNTTHWDGEHLVDLDLAGAKFFRHHMPLGVFRIHPLSLGGGVLGATGEKKYRDQLQLVNKKIDQSSKAPISISIYWVLWLMVRDPKLFWKRFLGKFFSS
jgi:glycosyltransferase involved in cell wall biosynthesis